jgi:hypothetical protein
MVVKARESTGSMERLPRACKKLYDQSEIGLCLLYPSGNGTAGGVMGVLKWKLDRKTS